MENCTLIQQLREPRLFGMVVFDWSLTLLGAYLLTNIVYSYYKEIKFPKLYFGITIILLVLAVFLHWLFGINTMMGYYMGLNQMPKIIRCSNYIGKNLFTVKQ